MASPAASALPSGITPPLSLISPTDQGGLIAIISAFSITLVLISFPIRAYVRSKTGTWKNDDYLFIGAVLFAILQSSCIFYAVSKGLGKSEELLPLNNIIPLEKAIYAGEILYIFVLFLSKCSTAFLLLRLTPGRGHFYALWTTIILSTAWTAIAIILVGSRCNTQHPWTDITSECTSLFARWQFVTALDVVTEVSLFLISVYIVWSIQMSFKSKSIVISAFGCRLPIIALAGIRLLYLHFALDSLNSILDLSTAISCTQLQIGYSILASIVPCLKTFIMPYDPALPSHLGTYHHYDTNTSTRLNSLTNTHISLSSSNPIPEQEFVIKDMDKLNESQVGKGARYMGRLRPEQTIYEARVTHGRERRESEGSEVSQKMIIKKGVDWSVDYEMTQQDLGGKSFEEVFVDGLAGETVLDCNWRPTGPFML